MIKPEFPYKGNQVIAASDRIMLYSKVDGVFLLGKATVGISSPGTINVDSKEHFLVFSPKISLGAKATEQVILGNRMVRDLKDVFQSLKNLSDQLANINETNFAAVVPLIAAFSKLLSSELNNKIISLDNNLSKTTYTQ